MNWRIGLALAVGAVLVFLATAWYTCGFQGCPDPKALLALEPGQAPEVLDRNGESFGRLVPLQREVVPLDSLPEHERNSNALYELPRRFEEAGLVHDRVASVKITRWAYQQVAREGGQVWVKGHPMVARLQRSHDAAIRSSRALDRPA